MTDFFTNNQLCRDLGLQYPVFQGAMAYISTAELAAAVSNAGGLGILYSGQSPADEVRAEIRRCRELTDKPFGVNLMLQNPHIDAVLDVVAAEGVPVVTTGAGSPAAALERLAPLGVKVIPVIPNVRAAKKAASLGAYAVVAEGTESGGHVGEMTTLALLPQVLDAVDIPVLAAGGIADGRAMAAMLLMGAVGVQMGTAFLLADECPISDAYKQKIIEAADTDTIVTGRGTSHVVRSLKNPMSLRYSELEQQGTDHTELDALAANGLKKAMDGDVEWGCMMAGQISGLLQRTDSCANIIRTICGDAAKRLLSAADVLSRAE